MEDSPLMQLTRPRQFKPKIVGLYEALFTDDNEHEFEPTEGFWEEFFLLRPDREGMVEVLDPLSADHLLRIQTRSQQLFLNALQRIKAGKGPMDDLALQTLTIFLDAALGKKWTNPSSDILSILVGLLDADHVMLDLIETLGEVIRKGRTMYLRSQAINAAVILVSASFNTGLPSYFMDRDLFPPLMKYLQDAEAAETAMPAFYLLGMLSNYNRFEFENPYRQRLEDYVNDRVISKIIAAIGDTLEGVRDEYLEIMDDEPEGVLGSTLKWVGLGALVPTSNQPIMDPEKQNMAFCAQPSPEAGCLLLTYDFIHANKMFASQFVTDPPLKKGEPPTLCSFFSVTSYLSHHAHRSPHRATLYTYLTLFTLQILVEDPVVVKWLCSDENKMTVRLCRQRQPYLPVVSGERVPAAIILDLVVDGINHNIKRGLDFDYYILCLNILLRLLTYLSRAKIRLAYHWTEVWRALFSFMKFFTTYANDYNLVYRAKQLVNLLCTVLVFVLSQGDIFLPDTAAHDDLFYKIIEAGDTLTKFKTAYGLDDKHPIVTLLKVNQHYIDLLEQNKHKANKKLTSKAVFELIKLGYTTLSIDAEEGLERWEKFREVDWRTIVKKVGRMAVKDARFVVGNIEN